MTTKPKTIKMIALDPVNGWTGEVFPWSGIEVTEMTPQILQETEWTVVPGIQAIDVWGAWNAQWDAKEIKGRRMLRGRSDDQLVQDFDQTSVTWEGTRDETELLTIAKVRGWILDELEYRDPYAFDQWTDGTDESPRRFFIKDQAPAPDLPVYTMERKLCDADPSSDVPEAIWTPVCAFHALDKDDANRKASRWSRYQGISQRDVRLRPATEHEATHWIHDDWMS